jgi:hypothetical protein
LRDFDSASLIDLYVFSERQATYLHSRIGGQMIHHPDVVTDQPSTRQFSDEPMNAAEKMRIMRLRLKMQEQRVSDAAKLAIYPPLTEREIQLANASYARQHQRNTE